MTANVQSRLPYNLMWFLLLLLLNLNNFRRLPCCLALIPKIILGARLGENNIETGYRGAFTDIVLTGSILSWLIQKQKTYTFFSQGLEAITKTVCLQWYAINCYSQKNNTKYRQLTNLPSLIIPKAFLLRNLFQCSPGLHFTFTLGGV